MPRLSFILLVPLVLGCTPFPELDLPPTAATERSAYPRLIPLTEILDSTARPPRLSPNEPASLLSRVNALRARAAAMRSRALTEADRERIRAAVARLEG
ncbi:hypothetical protein OCGS_0059 [Oceaniovalibus guishaninsula JLT2003]|uniref:Lipoprotein n=1 Tax=Oceaniovalibus guishaninsula JLT2003 TaxID=1231392 RepID=K2HEE4_9RHOB|nr:hypothetical protein [Oceaniovalibus guishaninsula]EKE45833.1 hypothetical protein OCGS_0059 [Oceaniovalibus guishaninsula JLT2003]